MRDARLAQAAVLGDRTIALLFSVENETVSGMPWGDLVLATIGGAGFGGRDDLTLLSADFMAPTGVTVTLDAVAPVPAPAPAWRRVDRRAALSDLSLSTVQRQGGDPRRMYSAT